MSEQSTATKLAAVLTALPLLVGVVVGLGAPAESVQPADDAVQIALHNLRIGWFITLGGVLTAGLITVFFAPAGWLTNGIVIGTAISSAGLSGAAPLSLSALPELVGFVLFTAGGLLSAVALWRVLGGASVHPRVVVTRSVKLAALGTGFLLVAAPLEALGGTW